MNLTLTNLNGPAPAPKGANDAAASAPFDAAAAMPGTVDAVQPAPAQPALAFAQWLGLDQLAPADVDATTAVAATDGAPAADDIPVEEQQATDTPLLGAMAMPMPLMPLISTPQATLAAVVAALPGASALPAAKESAPAADTEVSPSPGSAASGREGRAELAALPAAALPASAPALPLVETPVQAAVAKTAPAALAADTSAANGDTPQDQAAPVTERGAANIAGMASTSAPAAGTAPRTADTVTLAGPPTAWRQTLQEALGERLQLQVGNKAEQAVIRLEPPMLGRVEIAIRHSAGSLEVQISATHGEVLRQLQTVSESLRSDLAQRQFSDVSVNIVPTPRAANGAPMFAGGEGRGRQQDGRQQEQNPGNALAEANSGFSSFSLDGLSLSGRAQGRS
ncbi:MULTISPECIES: flagellar hook-length control protein FliK [unclassified Massilia]|uniref:flagellar hook-length control protein FliK n=1 Tax=unclassified Massilia TaxID=2609279 RepID=UPI0017872210|nr:MULTISPECIES: flagellar hook-length control protein FliK [unclassified Massilia]MBD8528986.1 flagellar hook-length control protein FliK [Massilia sp. CFBP 13647]MBD8672380.1 flagellar hook-length control protein FliK [Massilia sp. CFBP 13721]